MSTLQVIGGERRATLGECPVWDERNGCLHWVDIERGELLTDNLDGTGTCGIPLGQRIGCAALRSSGGGFIAAMESSIVILESDLLTITKLKTPKELFLDCRSNDGKCDREGNFWFGTCDPTGKRLTGWLYRLDPNGRLLRTMGPYICTNGPAFSPDGRTLYCADSYGKVIYRCDLTTTGGLVNQKVFTTFKDPAWGYPDGMTCDTEGYLWVAHWDGSRISRFGADGALVHQVTLPVTRPTSCTFGGVALRTLFVTSASLEVSAASNRNGLAGAVLAIDVEVGGLPACRYAG